MNDPIVEAVRRIRGEHGKDLPRIFEAARRQQGAEGRRVISFNAAEREERSCVLPSYCLPEKSGLWSQPCTR